MNLLISQIIRKFYPKAARNLSLYLPVMIFFIAGSPNFMKFQESGYSECYFLDKDLCPRVNIEERIKITSEYTELKPYDPNVGVYFPPGLSTSFQITPTEFVSGTATIPPVPTFTLEFPDENRTSQLLQANRSSTISEISKNESNSFWTTIRRYWPFVLLFITWIVIGIWFIFSQMILD